MCVAASVLPSQQLTEEVKATHHVSSLGYIVVTSNVVDNALMISQPVVKYLVSRKQLTDCHVTGVKQVAQNHQVAFWWQQGFELISDVLSQIKRGLQGGACGPVDPDVYIINDG